MFTELRKFFGSAMNSRVPRVKPSQRSMVFALALMGFMALSCEIVEPPVPIWPPDDNLKITDPVILSVDPAGGALSGIGDIVITGTGFSSSNDSNLVAVGGAQSIVLSSTSTLITISTPVVTGDSLDITVAVIGAELLAVHTAYKMEDAVEPFGGFGEFDDVYGMAVDLDENLYVSLNPLERRIVKVAPDGEKSDYGTTPFPKADAMKMGPAGVLYLAARRKPLYSMAAGGGSATVFARIGENAHDLDFDANGNIYAGGKNAKLFRVTPDRVVSEVAQYPALVEITAIRVFDGYVYIAGIYTGTDTAAIQEGIWRNEIVGADSIGPTELVHDWRKAVGETGPKLVAITFAADGSLYIGANRENSIYELLPPYDSTPEPFYAKVLSPPGSVLIWGNGPFLFVNRRADEAEEREILKVNMAREGAPYYVDNSCKSAG